MGKKNKKKNTATADPGKRHKNGQRRKRNSGSEPSGGLLELPCEHNVPPGELVPLHGDLTLGPSRVGGCLKMATKIRGASYFGGYSFHVGLKPTKKPPPFWKVPSSHIYIHHTWISGSFLPLQIDEGPKRHATYFEPISFFGGGGRACWFHVNLLAGDLRVTSSKLDSVSLVMPYVLLCLWST